MPVVAVGQTCTREIHCRPTWASHAVDTTPPVVISPPDAAVVSTQPGSASYTIPQPVSVADIFPTTVSVLLVCHACLRKPHAFRRCPFARFCNLASLWPISKHTIIFKGAIPFPQNNVPVTLGSSQRLPVGRNAITYVARDANGNEARTTTFVTVESGVCKRIYGEDYMCTAHCGKGPQPPLSPGRQCLIRYPRDGSSSPAMNSCPYMLFIAGDCVVSAFGPYSACSVTCGTTPGTQTRTRTVLSPKRGAGADCPPLVETTPCTANVACPGTWRKCGMPSTARF
jgi:hypothetical protein